MAEIWKDIPGYEGKYQASTEGRVRSLDRIISVAYPYGKIDKALKGRILRPGRFTKSGHLSVNLGGGSSAPARMHPVHQLVALTFLGPRPEGCEVCHNDGNPGNNAVSNLRYDTRSENDKDILRCGGKTAKLSLEDVDRIRELYASGMRCIEVAKLYGISKSSAERIKTGRTFGWYKKTDLY